MCPLARKEEGYVLLFFVCFFIQCRQILFSADFYIKNTEPTKDSVEKYGKKSKANSGKLFADDLSILKI